jgi:hypothetical protein
MRRNKDKSPLERVRPLLVVLVFGLLLVGVIYRMPDVGSAGDPGKGIDRRHVARTNAGKGVELLLTGEYDRAAIQFCTAIQKDETFSEAYMWLAATNLARAQFDKPTESEKEKGFCGWVFRDAEKALEGFRKHPTDAEVWPYTEGEKNRKARGLRISGRIFCIARIASQMNIDRVTSERLFQLLQEFVSNDSCRARQRVLFRWKREPTITTIVDRAQYTCPTLWQCKAKPKGSVKLPATPKSKITADTKPPPANSPKPRPANSPPK